MSRTKEQRSWDSFSASIHTSQLKCERIESNRDAFPDVVSQNRKGATVLLENKALDAWPKRDSTFPLRNAFEPGQLSFLRNWIFWGGHAYVLLRVGTSYWLLNPLCHLQTMTHDELIHQATISSEKKNILHFLEQHEK